MAQAGDWEYTVLPPKKRKPKRSSKSELDFLERLALAETNAYVEKYGKAKGPGQGVRFRTQRRDAEGHWVDEGKPEISRKPMAPKPMAKPASKPMSKPSARTSDKPPVKPAKPEMVAASQSSMARAATLLDREQNLELVHKWLGEIQVRMDEAAFPQNVVDEHAKLSRELKRLDPDSQHKPATEAKPASPKPVSASTLKPSKPAVDAKKVLKADADKRKLSDRDRNLLDGYSVGSEDLNSFLREPDRQYAREMLVDGGTANGVNGITDFLNRASTSQDTEVYRGLSDPRQLFGDRKIDPSLVGDVFTDEGFGSTSVDRKVAEDFSGKNIGKGTLMVVKVPKGSHGYYMNSAGVVFDTEEEEFLVQRGAKYTVTGVEEVDGHTIIQVELQTRTVKDEIPKDIYNLGPSPKSAEARFS